MDLKKANGLCRMMVEKSNLLSTHPAFGKDHLIEMLDKLATQQMSADKSARWWGYLVGVLTIGRALPKSMVSLLANSVDQECKIGVGEPVMNVFAVIPEHWLLVDVAKLPEDVPGASKEVLHGLLTRIAQKNAVVTEGHFYLGYVQGVLVASENSTLDEMKQINAKAQVE
jgi:hypothetical protein